MLKNRFCHLIPLAILSIIIGFVPQTVDNIYLVPPLAFCMGLVTTAFGEVSGIAYNNAFMTGNIKRTMLALEIISEPSIHLLRKDSYLLACLVVLSLALSFQPT